MSQNILSVWLVFHQLHSHPDRRPPQKNKRILGKLINWVDSGMAKYEMPGIDLTRSFKWFHMEYTSRVLSKFSHFRYRGSYLFQDINCLKKFSFIVHAAWKVSAFVVILVRIFPHSDWIREHSGQNNSEYGNFLRSVTDLFHRFSDGFKGKRCSLVFSNSLNPFSTKVPLM